MPALPNNHHLNNSQRNPFSSHIGHHNDDDDELAPEYERELTHKIHNRVPRLT